MMKKHSKKHIINKNTKTVSIPSRVAVLTMLKEVNKPITETELFNYLKIKNITRQVALKRRLKAMIRDGQLLLDRRKRFLLVDKLQLIKGRVHIHPDGYGFLLTEKGDDVFLSNNQAKTVLHGDYALVAHTAHDKKGRRLGIIKEVLSKVDRIIGQVKKERDFYYVIPENKRFIHSILIAKNNLCKAKIDQIVDVKLLNHPSSNTQLQGEIIAVLGDYLAPGLEIDIAVQNHNIPVEWSKDVIKEAKCFDSAIPDDVSAFRDLRNIDFVTIDGEDARDFDDAVFCKPKSNGGWILYVAIAHVGYFVKAGSAIDLEASVRGNSVYFPERVIPMLPQVLSCDLCSLVPKEDRLALVCKMHISNEGVLSTYSFFEAVICSKARLTYTQVEDFLHNKITLDAIGPRIQDLYLLYKKLKKTQEDRGMLSLDIPETKIIFTNDKKIKNIVPTSRLESHQMIESCMLMANIAAASLAHKEKLPVLYRNHKLEDEDKLMDLKEFLSCRKIISKDVDLQNPKELNKVIKKMCSRSDSKLLQLKVLQTLSAAVYKPKCEGHYGLALPKYAHFTSPIRRYPDLLLHREIVAFINGNKDKQINMDQLMQIGAKCSLTERRADEATRDVINWLKCEYMLGKVGKCYDGTIVSVTDFGLFIELKDMYVEGLVHISSLKNDYYRYDVKNGALYGERTSIKYQIGDNLTVKILNVDLSNRKIDFVVQE